MLRQLKLNRELVPAAYRLRGTYEWLRSRRKQAERWWSKSIAAAEQQGLRYDLAQALVEFGTHLGDPDRLAAGRAIHAELADALVSWRDGAHAPPADVLREPAATR